MNTSTSRIINLLWRKLTLQQKNRVNFMSKLELTIKVRKRVTISSWRLSDLIDNKENISPRKPRQHSFLDASDSKIRLLYEEDKNEGVFRAAKKNTQGFQADDRDNARTPKNRAIKISSPTAALKSKARISSKIEGSQAKRTKAEELFHGKVEEKLFGTNDHSSRNENCNLSSNFKRIFLNS